MNIDEKNDLRWNDYIFMTGTDFNTFWEKHLNEKARNILFILGLGFDPRMCSGMRAIMNAGGDGKRECLVIEFDEGDDSPSKNYSKSVQENKVELENLFSGKGTIVYKKIPMWSNDDRRIGARRASEIIKGSSELNGLNDVIVDVSALPRGIYFPLLTKLLYLIDDINSKNGRLNLHAVVTEDVILDKSIQEEGIDETACYLYGFSSDLEREATAGIPVIWIPVLGEGKETQLVRMYDNVKPDEICPVLPSPSRNPRRGDDLLMEYRELLFDRLRIEPQNIIYTCEHNPFETYRQIYQTIRRYHDSLEPLQGCKIVISAISSKLLSIGALLYTTH